MGVFVSFLFISYIGFGGGRPCSGFQLLVFVLYMRLFTALKWNRLVKTLIVLGNFLLIIGIPSIIHYQIPATNQYKAFYAICKDEKNDTVVFCFDDMYIPAKIQKYIAHRTYGYTYIDKDYSKEYNKPVYVTYAPIVNYNYSKENKIPGSNPFYKKDDYWITKEKLPESVTVTVEQGDYQLWDLPTLMRRCYNIIKPIPATSMTFSLKSDSLCIGKNQYVYYVQQTDRTPRKFLRVDVQP